MKKVLSLAIAAALIAPVAAMADATVYGKVRVSIDNTSWDDTCVVNGVNVPTCNSEGDTFVAGDGDSWATNDRVSRLGIKGSEDLGDGLKAIYKMEFAANVPGTGGLDQRNTYVGLAGDFGTALVGRHDTPLKMSTGKLDLFADTAADYDKWIVSDLRVDGALAYISPSFSGFTVAAANVTHPGGTEDFSDAFSIAGMYSNGPFYGSLAYETHETEEDVNLVAAGLTTTSVTEVLGARGNDSQTRLGLGLLDMSGFTVTFVYEMREGIGAIDFIDPLATDDAGWDSDSYMLAGAFKFTPNDQIKAMYGTWEAENQATGSTQEVDGDQWAVGYQHNFSNRTDAQVLYTAISDELTSTGLSAESEEDILSFQLNHAF